MLIEAWYTGSTYADAIVESYPIGISVTVNPCLYASITFGSLLNSPIQKNYNSVTENYYIDDNLISSNVTGCPGYSYTFTYTYDGLGSYQSIDGTSIFNFDNIHTEFDINQ